MTLVIILLTTIQTADPHILIYNLMTRHPFTYDPMMDVCEAT